MKIDDTLKKTGSIGVNTTTSKPGKSTTSKTDSIGKSPASTDSVHLSSTAQSLSQTGGSGVFDIKKVEEIKAAIANGTFKVDPEKVANGLLDTVNDLISTRKA